MSRIKIRILLVLLLLFLLLISRAWYPSILLPDMYL